MRAARLFSPRHDGLKQPWHGRFWLNPPYGAISADGSTWLLAEYECGAISEAVALVPARVDTRWFARLVLYPQCHIRGRLRFNDRYRTFPSAVSISAQH